MWRISFAVLAAALALLTGCASSPPYVALRTPDYRELLPAMLNTLDETLGENPHYLGWARQSYNDTLIP